MTSQLSICERKNVNASIGGVECYINCYSYYCTIAPKSSVWVNDGGQAGYREELQTTCLWVMVVQVVEFSSGGSTEKQ